MTIEEAYSGRDAQRPASADVVPPAAFSARSLDAVRILRRLAAAIGLLAMAMALFPGLGPWVLAVMGLPFACIALIRCVGLAWVNAPDCEPPAGKRMASCGAAAAGARFTGAEQALPRYAVLVPLYDEVTVLDQLITGLCRLDYPVDRLDIALIVEARDSATRQALAARRLPPHVRVVVVPDGMPRTKPRALNHALAAARGDFVVVYDAEDLPEPDQLRRVVATFRASDDRLGCVQARLDLYNSQASWLARQFTIEYAALFGGILPALDRLGLPIPLGGTSNHFPRAVLAEVGGWDAYNVTEDADLGIRLARYGYKVRVIGSTTWEEAPVTLDVWINQRTRWLKGWMQTYLVHMRHPLALLRDLGFYRFAGLQVLMGGMILSALVHPWICLGLAATLIAPLPSGAEWAAAASLHGPSTLALLTAGNLVTGYLTAIVLGAVAVHDRHPRLVAMALAMPAYWIVISLAAYRAVWQLATSPFLWEKTPHRGQAVHAAASTARDQRRPRLPPGPPAPGGGPER